MAINITQLTYQLQVTYTNHVSHFKNTVSLYNIKLHHLHRTIFNTGEATLWLAGAHLIGGRLFGRGQHNGSTYYTQDNNITDDDIIFVLPFNLCILNDPRIENKC